MDYALEGDATGRLVAMCRQAGATAYLSGPSARVYLDLQRFAQEGITVVFADYMRYPEYPQLYPPFEHGVSVIDLLVQTGPNARRFMTSAPIPCG